MQAGQQIAVEGSGGGGRGFGKIIFSPYTPSSTFELLRYGTCYASTTLEEGQDRGEGRMA